MANIVTSLGFNIFSKWDSTGAVRARRDIKQLDETFIEHARSIQVLSRRFKVLSTSIIAFSPALVPLSKSLLAVAGGIAAASTAAAAGVGVFGGAIALTTTKAMENAEAVSEAQAEVEKYQEAVNNATPGTDSYRNAVAKLSAAKLALAEAEGKHTAAQREFTASVENAKTSLNTFSDTVSGSVLPPVTSFVNTVASSIPKLVPLVEAMAPVANRVADAFQRWVDTRLDDWVSFLAANAVPATESFLQIANDLGAVFGRLLRDFQPFGQEILRVLAQGTGLLRQWAEEGGFTRFMDTVKAEGLAVLEFLRALGAVIKNLLTTMGTLAPLSLAIATALLKIVAAIPPDVLAGIVAGFLALKAVLGGIIIVKTIQEGVVKLKIALKAIPIVVNAIKIAWTALGLAFIANPIGLTIAAIVVGIGLLVAAFVILFKKSDGFRNFFIGVWEGIKSAAGTAVSAIQTGWNAFVAFLQAGANIIKSILHAIDQAFRIVLAVVVTLVIAPLMLAWKGLVAGLEFGWQTRIKPMLEALGNAFMFLWKHFVEPAWDGIKLAISIAWSQM
ncbi:hypothetical protein GCM10012275_28210 [Longimycelium tulufanense]|uniref:Uncharacterized protein n=1 Tax=Longimycelium tulufanense TaxID=907463 RepID=A0A8J3CCX4_9PSEU|nr:hypothetical protein [Longimycelium tulufanense]GGM55440.1 hypothetical protein GCM10012275_28210 [Longimycelium tulufanense]